MAADAASRSPGPPPALRVGYLGPAGTFTEQALRSEPALAGCDFVALPSIPEVLEAAAGDLDLGFAAIENSIEGSVNITLDTLAFDADLLIQRETILSVRLNLLAPVGSDLEGIERIVSFPHAVAQCRSFLRRRLPQARIDAANSTAEAVRATAAGGDPRTAAIGTELAGALYNLNVLATDIGDHRGNQTRFVTVAARGIPSPTGHDKTSLVTFQRSDRPGSLLNILQEFAARSINLTKLESRPTKRSLGDYCFIIDLAGHVADELVADCLLNIQAKQADVKFLGSYPAGGERADGARREADDAWRRAAAWIDTVRAHLAS
ncbi:MAG: prephenate dehydratase [bacterium]|nr:prephenate dehydratase [bacterium]MDE0668044.1 prephenate dehydratase [bacterium]